MKAQSSDLQPLKGIEAFRVVVEILSPDAREIGLSKDTISSKVELWLRRSRIAIWDDSDEKRFQDEKKAFLERSSSQYLESESADSVTVDYRGLPTKPQIAKLYVRISLLNYEQIGLTVFNIDVQVFEDALLSRYCCPPRALPDKIMDIINPEDRTKASKIILFEMLDDAASEAFVRRNKEAMVWFDGGLAYGPLNEASRQVMKYLEDNLDVFMNDYLASND